MMNFCCTLKVCKASINPKGEVTKGSASSEAALLLSSSVLEEECLSPLCVLRDRSRTVHRSEKLGRK